MKKSNFKTYLGGIGAFISRLGFLPANFSPLGSFGFFSKNFKVYLISIIAFDLLVGGFYKGAIFTYLGFFAYYLFGKLAKNNQTKQAVYLPIASLAFFILSNFGSWYFWYPHTISGLLACYIAALPFYKNTLLSDLTFGYGYIWYKQYLKNKQENKLKNWSLGELGQIQLGKNN
jgi:hypothetical protein